MKCTADLCVLASVILLTMQTCIFIILYIFLFHLRNVSKIRSLWLPLISKESFMLLSPLIWIVVMPCLHAFGTTWLHGFKVSLCSYQTFNQITRAWLYLLCFSFLSLAAISELIFIFILILTFKAIHAMAPNYLAELLNHYSPACSLFFLGQGWRLRVTGLLLLGLQPTWRTEVRTFTPLF